MAISRYAGKPAEPGMLVDVSALLAAYASDHPDPSVEEERVAFGTSGHRGSALRRSFNEAHILAILQAICEYRASQGTDGPLFLGIDTHALSRPALETALEVLVANDTEIMVDHAGGYTPTPVVSHAILAHNRLRTDHRADGVVISPSHNPPEDGGIKYNPPSGGPAGSRETSWIQDRANRILGDGLRDVRRMPYERARRANCVHRHDYMNAYVGDLASVVDMELIAASGLRMGVDPLGGASVAYWPAIGDHYGLELTVVNEIVDPTFGFMTRDWDGKIRMDCSSPHAMARLIELSDQFDVAFANDTDADRHGVVTPTAGLMNPNHYLAVVISYLFSNRPGWPADAAVGKTVVTTALIDRLAAALGRRLVEVPVGFKWFVDGLLDGSLGFGGEESAGASCLRRRGATWTTDKDGILLCLLGAEIVARAGHTLNELYDDLTRQFGSPVFERIDAAATRSQKRALSQLSTDSVSATELAGEDILAKVTVAPGNGEPIGGLKVITENAWFAARPSGTEDVYKIYAESFLGPEHLARVIDEARRLVDETLASSPTTGADSD
jgi:phosphoglucomutase